MVNELLSDKNNEGEDPEEEEEKDVDFDEVIIANTCDLIISFARALGKEYFTFVTDKTLELLIVRLSDIYSKWDQNLVLGALANIFLNVPNTSTLVM